MTKFYRNRPIKFRGRVPDSDAVDGGKIVYGSLVEYDFGRYRFWINPLVSDRNFPVEFDSVRQLVGYDRDGKEVYEGDTMLDENGKEFSVELGERGRRTDSCVFFDVDTNHYHLKEATL